MFDIITIGGATRDIIFRTEEGKIIKTPDLLCQKLLGFEYGAKIIIKKAYFTFGGGAQNSAIGFSRLGLKTATIMKIGKDQEGKLILENLKKEKVNIDFVQIDLKLPSGISLIVTGEKAKDHLAFCFRGANNNLLIPKQIPDCQWVSLSSLSGNWQEVLNRLFKNLKEKPKDLAWNPGNLQIKAGLSKLKKLLSLTKVLLLNKDEALELVVSNRKKYQKNIKFLLKFLKNYGPEIVVITNGRRGAWAIDEKKIYYQSSSAHQPVETTGAGDAFSSGFVAGLIVYKNIEQALNLAAQNSGSVVSKFGAEQGLKNLKEFQKTKVKNEHILPRITKLVKI